MSAPAELGLRMPCPTNAKASPVAADEALRKALTKQHDLNPGAPRLQREDPPRARDRSKILTSRSTATEAQNDKLAELLEIAPRHTHELRRLGISHPAGRVQDLEARGYVIGSDRVTTVDDFGFTHKGVARYSIISRPEPAFADAGGSDE